MSEIFNDVKISLLDFLTEYFELEEMTITVRIPAILYEIKYGQDFAVEDDELVIYSEDGMIPNKRIKLESITEIGLQIKENKDND